MLRQLVMLESERLVPKSMCESYRKKALHLQRPKAKKSSSALTR
jgi:hypothetical protein